MYIFKRTEELTAETNSPEFSWTAAFHVTVGVSQKASAMYSSPFLGAKASLEPDSLQTLASNLLEAPSRTGHFHALVVGNT